MKRKLTINEKNFILSMIAEVKNRDIFSSELNLIYVIDMDDGGMGSLKFLSEDSCMRSFGGILSSIKFIDLDGIPVIATLNLDNKGKLYELDIWKTDYSPLCHYLDSTYKIIEILN